MKKLALIVLLALALPATASAKGPSQALIVGPGVPPIRVSGAEGSSTPFWRLVETTGWFQAAWGTSTLSQTPPAGRLGPRYEITWTVPSSSALHQHLYPYATPSPVTYMPRGQRIYGRPVQGGWFTGSPRLQRVLVAVGMPARAPVEDAAPTHKAAAPARPSTDSGPPVGVLVAIAAIVLLVAAGGATSLRRRSSGAAGT
jgi:hypothetical protein